MQNALQCAQKKSLWTGNPPFLFDQYIKSGRNISEFNEWIEQFRSTVDPVSEIELYLKEVHKISVKSLSKAGDAVDDKLAKAIEDEWTKSHESRRSKTDATDSTIDTLARNDIEMYLGVIGLRNKEGAHSHGPRIWLLTKDTTAWNLKNKIKAQFKNQNPQSPLLSASFLLNAIAFSPHRGALNKKIEIGLPTILDIEFEETEYLKFLNLAEEIRCKNAGLPERTLRRMIRDELTKARWKK